MDKNKIVVLIPGNELTSELVSFVEDLKKQHFTNILIYTNREEKNEKYDILVNQHEAVIYTYKKNSNQLKERVDVILGKYPRAEAAIIADARGMYSAQDVEIIGQALATASDELILGVRQMKRAADAKRPNIWNRLIESIFHQLEKKISTESKTSLRAFSTENLKAMLEWIEADINNERNPLVVAKKIGMPFKMVPIYTDAVEVEERSYTSRIIDLVKVYKTFIKFTASSLFSTVVDLGLFTILIYIFRSAFPSGYIMVSTILARIVSIVVNYTINNKLVFKRKKQKEGSFVRYITLAIADMLISGFVVTLLVENLIPYETFTKVLVDGSLFFVGFLIQRKFVFTDDD